jgi:hypothetical protein
MTLEFLLLPSGFNSIHFLRDEQNSKCGGGVGSHKMHIFTINIRAFHSR